MQGMSGTPSAPTHSDGSSSSVGLVLVPGVPFPATVGLGGGRGEDGSMVWAVLGLLAAIAAVPAWARTTAARGG